MDTNPAGFADGPTHSNGVSKLEAPASVALCIEIAHLGNKSIQLAYAAALGACWHGPGNLVKHRGGVADVVTWAEACANALYARGAVMTDLLEGGATAYGLCVARYPTAAEVDEAEGNSSAGTEAPA